MEETIRFLKGILDNSNYTVALCGSGMTAESGFIGIKKSERAYEIERKYGASPEQLFSDAYYSTRIEGFYEFYRNEILANIPEPGPSSFALAAMERAGCLQCVITSNIFEQEQRGGCSSVINLHGTVFENHCTRCGRKYSVEEVMNKKRVPHCDNCNSMIRPGVSLFGEMVDSGTMTKTTEEIEKAEVMLLLGSTLKSDVFSHYMRYFKGSTLVIIHKNEHYMDTKANITILDDPKNVLHKLGY